MMRNQVMLLKILSDFSNQVFQGRHDNARCYYVQEHTFVIFVELDHWTVMNLAAF
jgi:hypothetical protein